MLYLILYCIIGFGVYHISAKLHPPERGKYGLSGYSMWQGCPLIVVFFIHLFGWPIVVVAEIGYMASSTVLPRFNSMVHSVVPKEKNKESLTPSDEVEVTYLEEGQQEVEKLLQQK